MINLSRFIKIREGNSLVRFSATLFIISVVILLLFLLFPGDNSSSDLVSKDLGQNGDPIQFKSNFAHYLLKTLGVTGFIVLIILVGFKWYKNKLSIENNFFSMDVLGKQHLSPKQYLMMVKIDEKKLLLGVTDQSIQLVKEFNGENVESNVQDIDKRENV